ncbi:MAG: hypothetical protein AAF236_12875, partial [Verrucomicrobiota bacterium]
MESLNLPLTTRRWFIAIGFAASTLLLIPLHQWILGTLVAVATLILIWRDPEPRLRRRLSVLFGCLAILAITDINPSLSNANFLQLGIPFTLVLVIPWIIGRFGGVEEREVIRYRFWPKRWRRADVVYTILSVPLAWGILSFYSWANLAWFDHELFRNWTLPEIADESEIRRLFIGINLVGIWDELFFINTVYALLRSLFRFPVAN